MAFYITHIARADPAPYPNGNGPVICYAPNAKFPQFLLAPAALSMSNNDSLVDELCPMVNQAYLGVPSSIFLS